MKRAILLIIGIAFFLSCVSTYGPHGRLNDYLAIQSVDQHTVAIVAIYEMSEEEYNKRIEASRRERRGLAFFQYGDKAFYSGLAIYPLQLAIPLQIPGVPNKFIAYIGAGKIIADGDKYSQTMLGCSHVLSHDENTHSRSVWIFKEGLDHAIEAEIVAKTDMNPWTDDYGVIKTKDGEHFGLPGLKIARPDDISKFDKIIFSGSVGGLAFFSRMVNMTDFRQFFIRGEDGHLHLSHWTDYKFWIFYPGGGGDSGGVACTLGGKIFTIMAWGIGVYDEQYIMGNPTEMLWAFLKEHKLEYLGR